MSAAATKKRTELDFSLLADEFLAQLEEGSQGKLVAYQGTFFLWEGVVYREVLKEDLRSRILSWLSATEYSSYPPHAGFVLEHVRGKVLIDTEADIPCWIGLNPPIGHSDCVAFANGILDLRTRTLVPSTPQWFSTICLPYEYNPEAKCQKWEAWLKDRLGEQDVIEMVQEFAGYCLTHDTSQQYCLIVTGEAGSGKSTMTEILAALVGDENTSYLDVDGFRSAFGLEGIEGKALNITDEGGNFSAKVEKNLKWYTGGKRFPIGRKYKPTLSVIPTAKLIINCNQIPAINDPSNGLYRRLLIVRFTKPLIRSEMRRAHVDALLAEAQGIFNWALEGRRRLLERGTFAPSKDSEQTVAQVAIESQAHRQFAEHGLKEDPASTLSTKEVWTRFQKFCEEEHLSNDSISVSLLGNEIKRVFPSVVWDRHNLKGRRQRGFKGIAFRE